jgi:hypothetical protein
VAARPSAATVGALAAGLALGLLAGALAGLLRAPSPVGGADRGGPR